MPKIAIFMNSLSGGGMERAMLSLADYLSKQGADVDLVVASRKGQLLSEIPESINLIDLGSSRYRFKSVRLWFICAAIKLEPLLMLLIFVRKLPKAVKVIPVLVDYINTSMPDVILSTPTTANLAMLWAVAYSHHDKKVVIREASTLSEEIENKKTIFFRLMRVFVRKWYNHADVVISVSDGVGEDLKKNFLIDDHRVKTIFNILDTEKIKMQSLSQDFDTDKYGKFILSIGRLEPQKDFETLIRAFHVIASNVSVNLLILGEGSMRGELEELIRELSLQHRIYMPGFIINPYPFIKKCEVLALSSRWEGAPNVLREAVVLGKKIVSTDCPSGPREILSKIHLSRLVPVGDYSALGEALLIMIHCEGSSIYNDENLHHINYESKLLFDQIFLNNF